MISAALCLAVLFMGIPTRTPALCLDYFLSSKLMLSLQVTSTCTMKTCSAVFYPRSTAAAQLDLCHPSPAVLLGVFSLDFSGASLQDPSSGQSAPVPSGLALLHGPCLAAGFSGGIGQITGEDFPVSMQFWVWCPLGKRPPLRWPPGFPVGTGALKLVLSPH